MKNLFLLIADMMMNKTGTYKWIAVLIMSKIRLVSMVLILSILSLIVIGSALNMIMMDLLRTTEVQQQLGVTSVSAVGLGIIVLALTAIYFFFKRSFWGLDRMSSISEPMNQNTSAPAQDLSPLMQALSILVVDFVDERREKRQRSSESVEHIQSRNS